MSLFSAFGQNFGQKGLAALASTLENIGNIVAPVPEDEAEDFQLSRRKSQDGEDELDEEEDTFESRIHSFINAKRLELEEPPSMDPLQSPNGSLVDIDLNDSDSEISSADNSFNMSYNKLKEAQQSPSSASSGVFLSNNELEKRVQMKYRESLETEIASFNSKLRDVEIKSQQNISRIQHDCDHWKSVAETQRVEISNLRSSINSTPKASGDNSELLVQYEECKQTNEQLTRSMNQTTMEFNQLNEQYDKLLSEHQHTNSELLRVRKEFESSDDKINRLEEECFNLRNQYNELKSSINNSNNDSDEKVIQLTNELTCKSTEISKLMFDLEELQNSLKSSNERNSQLSDELMTACDEVDSLNRQVDVLQNEKSNLQNEIIARSDELAKQTQHWNDLLTSSENALKDAETVAWTCKAEASEMLFALQLEQQKVVDLNKSIEELKVQNVLLTNSITALQSKTSQEHDTLVAKESDSNHEINSLRQSNAQMEVALQSKSNELHSLNEKYRNVESQLKESQDESKKYSEQLTKSEASLSGIQVLLAAAKAQIYESQATLDEEQYNHNHLVSQLRNEISALQGEVSMLQDKFGQSTESDTVLQAEIDELTGSTSKMIEQLSVKDQQLESAERKIIELSAQLSSIESALSEDSQKLNANVEASKQKQNEMETEIVALKQQLESQSVAAESNLHKLSDELKTSKTAHHQLEQQLQHQANESKNVLIALKKEVDKCQDLQSQNNSLKEQLAYLQSSQSNDSEKLHEAFELNKQRQAELENALQQLALSTNENVIVISDLQKEKQHLQSEVATHVEEINKLHQSITGLKTQLTSVKEEIISLTVSLEHSKTAQHNAELQKDHLETESRNVLLALKKEVEKCQELQKENAAMKEQLSHNSATTIVNNSTVDSTVVVELQNQLASLQNESHALRTQLMELTEKCNSLEAEKVNAISQSDQKNQQVEELTKQLTEQAKYSEMSIKSAIDAKAAAEAELQAANARFNDVGNHYGTAKQQIQKFETENRQLHQVIAQLRQVRKTNKGEEENVLAERDELKTQNTNLISEVSRLEKLANASAANAEQVTKLRGELNASMNKAIYLEQALDETKRQLALLEKDHYNKESQLVIVSSDLMLAKQDLELSQLEVRNLKDAMNIIQMEQQSESQRLHHDLEERTKLIHAQYDNKQRQLIEEYAKKYEDCLARAQIAEQQSQDEQLFRRRAELDFNNEKKKVQKTLESALQQLNNTQQDVVDRMLISNLIVSYFKRRRSMEVMELIAKVLSFNEEQKVVVGLRVAPVNLISSIFATVIGSGATPTATVSDLEGDNLAEQWINFLITEAENKPANSSK